MPIDSAVKITAIMPSTFFGNSFAPVNPYFQPNTLLKDTGKSIITTLPNGMESAKYAKVQLVSGNVSEGVPVEYAQSQNMFVRVWDANPNAFAFSSRIGLARIG